MPESTVKLLNSPYGVAAFGTFRRHNRAFADKSGMIQDLDDDRMTPYPVLLRPRRFGKSTFLQMLKCFYDISYADRYEELFAGTAIYSKHLPSHNTYHVVNFDFSGVSGDDKSTLIGSFVIALKSGISDFRMRYPDFVFEPDENAQKTPSGFIKSFFEAYALYPARRSLYLMIDEYDNCANSILSQDPGLFREIASAGGFLKDFYAAIKEAAAGEDCVAKTFITGVSSISLDSLTSGFNITLNVSANACFNTYAGFTESELEKLIPELIDIKSLGVTVAEVIARMKPVYDGYCFSRGTTQTVYNSSMCLYYLTKVQETGAFLDPADYMDPASDHDGSKLQQLFGIAEEDLAEKVTDTYLAGGTFPVKKLAENINLNKSEKYDYVQLLSMLCHLGYLTIDPKQSDHSILYLKIPNLFMAKLFAQCTVALRLKPSSLFRDQPLEISSLVEVKDDISSFARSCTEFLSSIFTNQVLSHMSEMALNLVLHAKLDTQFGVFAEMQKSLRVVGEGEKYADLVITVNDGTENACIYLIELKYTAKSDATEGKIMSLREKAAGQLEMYRKALEFQGKQIKAYAMIFAGSECVYCG